MPAGYQSTARALSLPVSPPGSPSSTRENIVPPWRRSLSDSSRMRRPTKRSFKDEWVHNAEVLQRKVLSVWKKMKTWQRILAIVAVIILGVLGVLFLIFNERLFGWLHPVAVTWRNLPAGWLIVWAMIFVCAFPPVIGYTTCVMIAGFLYGFRNGWLIAATATVAGSTCAFLTSRTLFQNYVNRLVANDKRFAALALTLKHDGLKLLCMIRLCPLPYSLTNGAMSTFPTVQPLSYALATAISTPKIMIHVFIGGRLSDLAERGEKMDASTKAINYTSITVGIILGVSVGWFIYRRTVARAEQLEAEERSHIRDSPENEDAIGRFSDDIDDDAIDADGPRGDDISLFENEVRDGGYRDEFSDDDDDDEDDEARIGIKEPRIPSP